MGEEEKELVVSNPATWRKENCKEWIMETPSGLTLKVKNVNLTNMIMAGIVPLELMSFFSDVKKKNKGKTLDKMFLGIEESRLQAVKEAVNKIAMIAVIEPKIVEGSGSDETIGIDEIDFVDAMSIFSEVVGGGATDFKSFRKE